MTAGPVSPWPTGEAVPAGRCQPSFTLLAEILVDRLVVAALSHRLRRIDSPLSIGAVLRRTRFPAGGIALALGLTGFLLQRWNPAIDSIGDVLRLFGRR